MNQHSRCAFSLRVYPRCIHPCWPCSCFASSDSMWSVSFQVWRFWMTRRSWRRREPRLGKPTGYSRAVTAAENGERTHPRSTLAFRKSPAASWNKDCVARVNVIIVRSLSACINIHLKLWFAVMQRSWSYSLGTYVCWASSEKQSIINKKTSINVQRVALNAEHLFYWMNNKAARGFFLLSPVMFPSSAFTQVLSHVPPSADRNVFLLFLSSASKSSCAIKSIIILMTCIF